MIHIILFGPPGSGKGTQANRLEDRYNFAHISTGDLFRHHLKNKTELGQKAKKFMDHGELVPDEITVGMLRTRLGESSDSNGIIYDGFPRTIPQSEALDNMLREHGERVDALIALEVSEGEIVHRIKERGKTSGREDDLDEDIIRNRIDVYREQTRPVYDYYDDKDLSHTIDGMGSKDEIFERISSVVDSLTDR